MTDAKNLKMELDFKGLIQILAGHLYSKKEVFVRELIQNSHDAIWRRHHADPNFEVTQGTIDIITDLASGPGRMVVRDNGIGMREEDLVSFLAAIGRSGTRESKADAPEVIGQFGIGFLSGFVVAGRIEVRTRHYTACSENGCLWVSNGDQDYTITQIEVDKIGTEVTILLKDASDRGVLQEESLRKVITTYADMLRVSIHLNDPQHNRPAINMRIMPWECEGISKQELRLDNMIYLEKRVPDNVLEVIPVNELDVQGLLYITRTRVIGRDAPRTVRVFLKRMFLCEGADELLPRWASFINGLLNTTALEPNAARDRYMEDQKFVELRDRLGELVIAHLEDLKTSDPRRLSEILAYHDFGIKAACHYYDEFFEKFGHLLEWRINSGSPLAGMTAGHRSGPEWQLQEKWITLPELVAQLPNPKDGGPKKLSCFTSHSSARQYFEMADAAGTTVLDASSTFEGELLKSWAKRNEAQLSLIHVDRQDDPSVFRDIDSDADAPVRELAQFITANLKAGSARVRVEARRFNPEGVTSVIRDSEKSASLQKAHAMMTDPATTAELKKMAEDLIRMSRNSDIRMFINADNELVRALAVLVQADPKNDDALELALGLYNAAILSNSRGMDPSNAKIFSEQYQRLMRRILSLSTKANDLRQQELDLNKAMAALQPKVKKDRQHLRGFHVTSFGPSFDEVRRTVRTIVEQDFYCELLSADHRKHRNWISDNVREHIVDADFFIVDLTEPTSLNVLIETGAINFSRQDAPALYISGVETIGAKPKLPADLDGLIAYPYLNSSSPDEWRSALSNCFKTDVRFERLRSDSRFSRYISPGVLDRITKNAIRSIEARVELSKALPTQEAWRRTSVATIAGLLQAFGLAEFAPIIHKLVLDADELN